MLATLDAVPAKFGDEFTADLIADIAAKPMVKELQFALSQMADGLRAVLGWPYHAYAATPLAIFRKLQPPSSEQFLPFQE